MSPTRPASSIIPAKKVVLIEPAELKSVGGIEYVQEKKQETGTIVAIGEGKMPVEMKVGNILIYRRYGEDKLFFEGKEYLFVTFADVLGVIK